MYSLLIETSSTKNIALHELLPRFAWIDAPRGILPTRLMVVPASCANMVGQAVSPAKARRDDMTVVAAR